jgi:hypothetical protein
MRVSRCDGDAVGWSHFAKLGRVSLLVMVSAANRKKWMRRKLPLPSPDRSNVGSAYARLVVDLLEEWLQ